MLSKKYFIFKNKIVFFILYFQNFWSILLFAKYFLKLLFKILYTMMRMRPHFISTKNTYFTTLFVILTYLLTYLLYLSNIEIHLWFQTWFIMGYVGILSCTKSKSKNTASFGSTIPKFGPHRFAVWTTHFGWTPRLKYVQRDQPKPAVLTTYAQISANMQRHTD